MDGLPIEAQFSHASFMADCQRMSPDQRLDMLEKLHLSYLGHREFIKLQTRYSLGLDVVPVGEMD